MSIPSPAVGQRLAPPEPPSLGNPPQATRVEPSNCMERIVQWLRSDKTPLLLKIGAVALVVIGTVGIGILVGYPLLVSAIVLIPTTIWAIVAHSLLADKETAAAEHEQRQQFCRAMHGSVREDPQASANFQQMLSEVLEGSQASFTCNRVLSEMRRNPQALPTLQRMLNETRINPQVSVQRMLSEISEDPQASTNLQQILSEMLSEDAGAYYERKCAGLL